jgi:hypothetical protein
MVILDEDSRVPFDLGQVLNYIFECGLEERAQPIIFAATEEQDSAPIGHDAGQDCKDNVMVELHWALLSILIGCIIGDYFGRLYGLRYRSNT